MEFKNKVIVITGASSGIGEGSAIQFAKKGANIVLISRRKEKLLEVEKKISKFNVKTLTCVCDVSQKSQVQQMAKKVLEKFGRIDILVNNAGFAIHGHVSDLSIEEIEAQMATNYFGMIYCIKNFLPKMIEQNSGRPSNRRTPRVSMRRPIRQAYRPGRSRPWPAGSCRGCRSTPR